MSRDPWSVVRGSCDAGFVLVSRFAFRVSFQPSFHRSSFIVPRSPPTSSHRTTQFAATSTRSNLRPTHFIHLCRRYSSFPAALPSAFPGVITTSPLSDQPASPRSAAFARAPFFNPQHAAGNRSSAWRNQCGPAHNCAFRHRGWSSRLCRMVRPCRLAIQRQMFFQKARSRPPPPPPP